MIFIIYLFIEIKQAAMTTFMSISVWLTMPITFLFRSTSTIINLSGLQAKECLAMVGFGRDLETVVGG